ncbi:hypothetical protein NDU88_004230 [Pleurodeles waltl]|uniref:Uncharacterized protein n=1 Tax=Pleurodeles waltl TaxID=8319 RepID=A0AAV7W8E2_PLEWA|nr:hypothetical protein NDU88_004230 [Pleurodeles waltl]
MGGTPGGGGSNRTTSGTPGGGGTPGGSGSTRATSDSPEDSGTPGGSGSRCRHKNVASNDGGISTPATIDGQGGKTTRDPATLGEERGLGREPFWKKEEEEGEQPVNPEAEL